MNDGKPRVPRDPPAAPAVEATPQALCVECCHGEDEHTDLGCVGPNGMGCDCPGWRRTLLQDPAPASPPEPAPDYGITGCLREKGHEEEHWDRPPKPARAPVPIEGDPWVRFDIPLGAAAPTGQATAPKEEPGDVLAAIARALIQHSVPDAARFVILNAAGDALAARERWWEAIICPTCRLHIDGDLKHASDCTSVPVQTGTAPRPCPWYSDALLAWARRAREERDRYREWWLELQRVAEGRPARPETAEALAAAVRQDAGAADARALREALREVVDVAVWMSGSDDFSPGGKAGNGWPTQRLKLYRAMDVLTRSESETPEGDADGKGTP